MTRNKAIRLKCLECSGDSPKEVTLCHLFGCSLWEYRTGTMVGTKAYRTRMSKAIERYPSDVKELVQIGIQVSQFRATE